DLAAALRHVERVFALYDPVRHRPHSGLFGQDPGVICLAYGAVALWLAGQAEAAERQSSVALQMSREMSPSSQAVALHFAAMLQQMRRHGPRTGEYAEAAAAVAGEHGLRFWLAGSAVMGGWASAACGDAERGLARLRQGLRDWEATGS